MEKYFDCCICGQIIDINAGDDYTSLENKVCAGSNCITQNIIKR
jgi:hypothetical protein